MIATIDSDHSGSVDFDEFMGMMMAKMAQRDAAQAAQAATGAYLEVT